MTQVIEVTEADIDLIFTPVVIVTKEDLPFDFDAALDELRRNPMPWRLTDVQMDEIERDRVGESEIAPYISF